jgi:uncharacterized surface protein with fasciclin (FAS1) repeats
VSFPFTTDSVTVPAGRHTLSAAITGHDGVSASTSFDLAASHDYSLVVSGEHGAGEVEFVLVDHDDLPLEVTSSAAILVNLYSEALDVYFDDTLVVESLAEQTHAFVSVPISDFTISVIAAGQIEDVLYTTDGSGLPNTTYLGVSRSSTSGDFQNIQHMSSNLNAGDYLAALGNESEFSRIRAILDSVGQLETLNGDGAFTLFLPVNGVLVDVAEDVLPEPGYYLVPQNLPPYMLTAHDTLETLSGEAASLDFGDTESGYWEFNGAPILWDVRVANGVIYAIEGLMLPPQ